MNKYDTDMFDLRADAENPPCNEGLEYQCTNCMKMQASLLEGALCFRCWKENEEAWKRFREVSA